jgi:predicted nucleic acid-binding protein
MARYYADSSALVKRHVNEQGSTYILNLCQLRNGHSFITS